MRFFSGISLRKSLPIENLDKYPLVSGPHQIFNEENSGGFDNNPLLTLSAAVLHNEAFSQYLVRPEYLREFFTINLPQAKTQLNLKIFLASHFINQRE